MALHGMLLFGDTALHQFLKSIWNSFNLTYHACVHSLIMM